MSETSHQLGVFLPSVSGIGAFQAEGGFIAQEWEIGWPAAQTENYQTR